MTKIKCIHYFNLRDENFYVCQFSGVSSLCVEKLPNFLEPNLADLVLQEILDIYNTL